MRAYKYTAIIKKTMIQQGKVTFVDKRAEVGTIALDASCIIGHVLADDPNMAKAKAIHALKQTYPYSSGYHVSDRVRVEPMPETIIDVSGNL